MGVGGGIAIAPCRKEEEISAFGEAMYGIVDRGEKGSLGDSGWAKRELGH